MRPAPLPPTSTPPKAPRQKSVDLPQQDKRPPLNKSNSVPADMDPGHIKKVVAKGFQSVVGQLKQRCSDKKLGPASNQPHGQVPGKHFSESGSDYEPYTPGQQVGGRKSLEEVPIHDHIKRLNLHDEQYGSDFVEELYEDLDNKQEEIYEVLDFADIDSGQSANLRNSSGQRASRPVQSTVMKTCDKCSMLALMSCTQCRSELCGLCIAHHDMDPAKKAHNMQNLNI